MRLKNLILGDIKFQFKYAFFKYYIYLYYQCISNFYERKNSYNYDLF